MATESGRLYLQVDNLQYTQAQKSTSSAAWIIDNFQLICELRKTLYSQTYFNQKDNLEWRIQMTFDINSYKNFINFWLQMLNKESLPEINQTIFRFSIICDKGEKLINFSNKYSGTKENYIGGINQDNINRYLQQDKLIIFCEIETISEPSTITGHSEIPVRKYNLYQDLVSLLHNEKLSDFTLVADGLEFKVHKAILGARSPVFAAMFSHDMEEKQSNRAEIKDIKHQVLKEMLNFIYTDEVTNLKDMAHDLFVAADKFELEILKAICLKELSVGLCVDNVVKTLIFADLYSLDELKAPIAVFIKTHAFDMLFSEDWKELTTTHTLLISEIFKDK